MFSTSICVLQVWHSVFVNMSTVIVFIGYWFEWLHKLAYIYSSCLSAFFQIIIEVLELVCQIVWFSYETVELCLFINPLLSHCLSLLLLYFIFSNGLVVLELCGADSSHFVLLSHVLFVQLRYVEEPLAEIVNRVGGLRLVKHSASSCDNFADLLWFEVFGGWSVCAGHLNNLNELLPRAVSWWDSHSSTASEAVHSL